MPIIAVKAIFLHAKCLPIYFRHKLWLQNDENDVAAAVCSCSVNKQIREDIWEIKEKGTKTLALQCPTLSPKQNFGTFNLFFMF